MSRTLDTARWLVALLVMGVLPALAGCGRGDGSVVKVERVITNPDGTRTAVVRIVPASSRSRGTRTVPPASGSEVARAPRRTPPLGPRGCATCRTTPPPTLTPPEPPAGGGPGAPAAFDGDTAGVLSRYRIDLAGRDVNQDTAGRVARGAQLFENRSHSLRVVLQQDNSKLPVAGVWFTRGGRTEIQIYQPRNSHVIDHELAHDVTLKVDRRAGSSLGTAIQANSNNPATFPTSYSRTSLPEAMAEVLSTLAEQRAGISSGRIFHGFNPPSSVREAAGAMFGEALGG